MKKGRWLPISLLCASLCCTGCVSVTPVIAGTPTPSCSPTPLAEFFSPEIVTTPVPKDELGNRFGDDDHYGKYVNFSNVLIYEYDTGTFLDGLCTNDYPSALEGRIDILYHTNKGKLCGTGTIHSANGSLVFQPGTNPIYAEIMTDIDVTGMDYTISIVEALHPVSE